MPTHKFDEVHCQILKVSGPNKIDSAVDITEQAIKSASGPQAFTITKAAGGANEVEITISPIDSDDAVLTGLRSITVWASDDSAGAGVSSTWAIDSIAAKSTFGAVLSALTANKHVIAQTNASGVLTLVLTDAATGGGYVAVENPFSGLPQLIQVEAGDYGS